MGETLDFGYCNLNDDKASAIASGLKNLDNVKSISFANNNDITVDGWTLLAGSFPKSTESLDVGFCNLNDDKASAIASGLNQLYNLKNINLIGNGSWSSVGITGVGFTRL